VIFLAPGRQVGDQVPHPWGVSPRVAGGRD
jgi:hypothetical protein